MLTASRAQSHGIHLEEGRRERIKMRKRSRRKKCKRRDEGNRKKLGIHGLDTGMI